MEGKHLSLGCCNKYLRLQGSNTKHLFLTVQEAWRAKIKVPTYTMPSEELLPGLQTATFSVSLNGEEGNHLFHVSSYEGLNLGLLHCRQILYCLSHRLSQNPATEQHRSVFKTNARTKWGYINKPVSMGCIMSEIKPEPLGNSGSFP